MNDRLNELLPWYVNGTLNEQDRQWVAQYLREHPQASGQLHFYESLRDKLHEDTPQVSDEIGLSKAMARIHALGKIAPAQRQVQRAPSLMERLRDWIGGIGLTPALGAALAVVLVQALVIGSLIDEPDAGTEIRAVPPVLSESGAFVKVNFKADAKEADIRMLLVETHGSLAAGPGQLGDYYVRVDPAKREQLLAQFKASGIVDAASVVDGLPARE
jgi:hypothetical protein